ncbi:MAG: hypothetical protein J6S54_01675 [Lentisphaeria bacterium]|nr:hypothetical protein [Lentisphaeria bacterium]
MKVLKQRKFKNQQGAVIFESVLAICVLMLAFFALFQIYRWAMAELFCHYSVYYSTKAASLGYKPNIGLRAARVAAIAISGGRSSTYADEESHAESYMRNGDASGVSYPYWHPQSSKDPCLTVASTRLNGETIECLTVLEQMPLVHEVLGRIFGITRTPSPRAEAKAYNFSNLYLEP